LVNHLPGRPALVCSEETSAGRPQECGGLRGRVLGNGGLNWKHARLGELIWSLAGQGAVVVLGAAGCWLVGAVRAVRRRAPLLRRRYRGRYVPSEDVRSWHWMRRGSGTW
jgi:hypothetical protein